jgi:hypothetical protein
MVGSVPRGTVKRQYCPEPRIPLDTGSGACRPLLASARAAEPARAGFTVPAIIVAYVFIISFLFTFVNTQYGTGMLI